MATIEKILANGYKAVMKTSGKQTMLQIFDKGGTLIRTRVRSVEKQLIPPKPSRKALGYIQPKVPEMKGKIKDVFTIKKNDYNHLTQESTACVVDRVYIEGKRVGERVKSATGHGEDAMAAMHKLRGDYSYPDKNIVNKILRFFRGGKLEKENQYVFENGVRKSRYIVDFELEAALQEARSKLDKLNTKDACMQEKLSSLIKHETELCDAMKDIEHSINPESYGLALAEQAVQYHKEGKTIEKLLTQHFNTPEEFDAIIKELKQNVDFERYAYKVQSGSIDIKGNYIDDIITDVLENHENLQFRSTFDIRDSAEEVLKYANQNLQELEQNLVLAKRTYKKKLPLINRKITKLRKEKAQVENELKKIRTRMKTISTLKASLEDEIREIEANKQKQTLEFSGCKLRADIGGIDFTL